MKHIGGFYRILRCFSLQSTTDDIISCLYTYHHSQLYSTGKRIWIRHLCDDVLSVLPTLVWRFGDAFWIVGWEYGADDSCTLLAMYPLEADG